MTSNKSLRSWASVLNDSSLAAALIDRLMHHGEVFYLSGDSYRLRGKQKYLEKTVPEREFAPLSEKLLETEEFSEKKGDEDF